VQVNKFTNENDRNQVILSMTQDELDIIWQFVEFAQRQGLWSDIAPEGSIIKVTIDDFIRQGKE
jgi:hypothetical protein